MEGRRHRHAALSTLACIAGTLALCNAQAQPTGDAFYHQLLKTSPQPGYQPTRSFTIVTDEENGNQLVAVDDPDLRFNVLWMQQFQPGYRTRNGGAALGEVLRGYVKAAYKTFRQRHAQTFSSLPDENGAIRVHSISSEMEYHLNWTGKDFKFGVEYDF